MNSITEANFYAQIEIQLGFPLKVGDRVELFSVEERADIITMFLNPECKSFLDRFIESLQHCNGGKITSISLGQYFHGPNIFIIDKKGKGWVFPLLLIKSVNEVEIDYERLATRGQS